MEQDNEIGHFAANQAYFKKFIQYQKIGKIGKIFQNKICMYSTVPIFQLKLNKTVTKKTKQKTHF